MQNRILSKHLLITSFCLIPKHQTLLTPKLHGPFVKEIQSLNAVSKEYLLIEADNHPRAPV